MKLRSWLGLCAMVSVILVGLAGSAQARPDPSGYVPTDKQGNASDCYTQVVPLSGVGDITVAAGWPFTTVLSCESDWQLARIRWFSGDYHVLDTLTVHGLDAGQYMVSEHTYPCPPGAASWVSTAKVKVKLLKDINDQNPYKVWLLYEAGFDCAT